MSNTTDIIIREIRSDELHMLNDLLYEAIFQPDKYNLISRDVLELPEVRVYIDDFGKSKDDYCLVADLNGKIIGGVWVRILCGSVKGFGNIDDKTPEFAISLCDEYRNKGIGTKLMLSMIEYLNSHNYKQTSLSVQKANYAVKLYKNMGFEIIHESDEEFLMLLKLSE